MDNAPKKTKKKKKDDVKKDKTPAPAENMKGQTSSSSSLKMKKKRKLTNSSKTKASTSKRALPNEGAVAHMSSLSHHGRGIGRKEFKKLLKERKAEYQLHLKQKLQEEMEKIEKRNSEGGGAFVPIAKAPHEAWVKLLDPPPPEDESGKLVINPAYDQNDDENRIREIFLPLMLHYKGPIVQGLEECPIWDSEFLQLREVSHSMRDAMDQCLEDEFLQSMQNTNSVAWEWLENRKPIEMHMPYDLPAFHKILKIHPPLKLIRREMEVTIKSPSKIPSFRDNFTKNLSFLEHFKLFRDNVTDVLNQIGEQIWSFEFTFGKMTELDECGVSTTQIYSTLRKWLLLLPNLKWLKIVTGVGIQKKVKPPDNVKEIDLHNSRPPPTLSSLERLDFTVPTDYDYDYFLICDAIARANPQIKMLYYYGSDFHRRVPQSKLEELNLELLILENSNPLEQTIDLLPLLDLNCLNWNLKRLNLYLNLSGAEINPLFKFVNKFPTLEALTFRIESVAVGGEIDFLRLPNLKKFFLEFEPIFEVEFNRNSYFFFTLQFLLYCSKLKSIYWGNSLEDCEELERHIKKHMEKKKNKRTMIGFNGGSWDLSDSNLKDVFPYLEEVWKLGEGNMWVKEWERVN